MIRFVEPVLIFVLLIFFVNMEFLSVPARQYLQHMDKEALWYGPAAGQFIRGQDAMIRIWSKEEHPLKFTMGDLETETVSAHPSSCNVMLTYTVITHYPDGHDLSVDQRLLLCWGERHITDEKGNRIKQPRILVCHISNPHGKHEDDVIYPKHFTQAYAGENIMPQNWQGTIPDCLCDVTRAFSSIRTTSGISGAFR